MRWDFLSCLSSPSQDKNRSQDKVMVTHNLNSGFIDGEPQFDGYECRSEMYIADGQFVYGDGEQGGYYQIWCWEGKHPLVFGSKSTGKFVDIIVNDPPTAYKARDKKGNEIVFELTTGDADCIQKCFESIYPIKKDGEMMDDYPSIR
jgi:hypothetical protein